MKHRFLLAVLPLVALLLLVSCINTDKIRDILHLNNKPLTFEVYEQKAEVTGFSDDPEQEQSLVLALSIPAASGKRQEIITKALIEIIKSTAVARALGEPKGDDIKEVADNYVLKLKTDFRQLYEDMKSRNDFCGNLVLRIHCIYQNEACVVFYVEDAGSSFENDRSIELVVRLSDGHVMTNDEIAHIDREDLKRLAKKCLGISLEADVELDDKYALSVGPEGLLLNSDLHYTKEYVIPYEAAEPFLTDEGKMLLTAKRYDNPEDGKPSEPIKGDLALYELRGPVQQLEIVKDGLVSVFTFDKEGRLTKEKHVIGGDMVFEELTFGRTDRDAEGRGAVRHISEIAKEINTFDEYGRRIKMDYKVNGRLEFAEVYYYNSQGLLYKMNSLSTVHSKYYSINTTKYFDYKTDSFDNWTERRSTVSTEGGVEKRNITYYQ